jgi:hypothetical protein
MTPPVDLAARARQRCATAAPPRPAPAKDKGGGDRWHTYNEFVDHVAPLLSLADRAVWHVMFRHARHGVCETTERQLAEGAGVSCSTVAAALKRLRDAGLVWPIWLSKSKGTGSKWGIHARPRKCREKLGTPHEPPRPSVRVPP